MNHIKALVLKFVMIAAVLLVILTLLYDVSFGHTLAISAVLTLVAYVIGDLLVFRKKDHTSTDDDQKKRNTMATIGDIVIAFLVIWLVGDALIDPAVDIIQASLISAIIIGAGEWFFHKYLDRHVFNQHHHTQNPATVGRVNNH